MAILFAIFLIALGGLFMISAYRGTQKQVYGYLTRRNG